MINSVLRISCLLYQSKFQTVKKEEERLLYNFWISQQMSQYFETKSHQNEEETILREEKIQNYDGKWLWNLNTLSFIFWDDLYS